MKKTLEHYSSVVIQELNARHCKSEVHKFPSAVMIDLWLDNQFYALQLEEERFGISLVDDKDPGFDSIPNNIYSTFEDFQKELKRILG